LTLVGKFLGRAFSLKIVLENVPILLGLSTTLGFGVFTGESYSFEGLFWVSLLPGLGELFLLSGL